MNMDQLDNPEARLRRRGIIETLCDRAEMLLPEERVLVHAVYRHGLTVADVARLRGKPRRSVNRQLSRILARLSSAEAQMARRLQGEASSQTAEVTRMVMIQGRTLRDTADACGLTLHQVRKVVDAVRESIGRIKARA